MSSFISQLIWNNDIEYLQELLEQKRNKNPSVDFIGSLDEWDHRGYPPLHLAIALGRKQIAKLLLKYGASANSINIHNYSTVDQATFLGDRELLGDLYQRSMKEDFDDFLASNGPWHKFSMMVPELSIEIVAKLKSTVPILANICPRETVRIWKKNDGIRIDWTIRKISGFKISRSEMSFLANVTQDGVFEAFVIDRKSKIYEKIFPMLSQSIIHDIVDSLLSNGIVKDELPISEFEVQRSTLNLGSVKKPRTETIKKHGYRTDIYKIHNLRCRQVHRVPIVIPKLYEECTDECRSIPIKDHLDQTKQAMNGSKHKIEKMTALQFISESDLSLDNSGEATESQLSRAAFAMKKKEEEVTEDDVQIVDKTIREYLAKIGSTTSKHLRSLTGNNGIFRSRTKTSSSIHLKQQSEKQERDIEMQMKNCNFDERQAVRMHIKDFPQPSIQVCQEEYFAEAKDQEQKIRMEREYHGSTANYIRNDHILWYQCKEFPISLYDILPIFEWAMKNSTEPGKIQNWIDKNFFTGFPVRIEIPIVSMLAAKFTITKCEKKVDLKSCDFELPPGFQQGEIFPLVEYD